MLVLYYHKLIPVYLANLRSRKKMTVAATDIHKFVNLENGKLEEYACEILTINSANRFNRCLHGSGLLPRPYHSIKGIDFFGLATLATKTVACKNCCIYGYAFDITSVSLLCVYIMQNRAICTV